MECHTLNRAYVEAKNKEEAIEKAKNELRGQCSGDGMEMYEVEITNP